MIETVPSISSISTSSDEAPQLSYDYIWHDDGNFDRLSKRSPEAQEKEQIETSTLVEKVTGVPQNKPDSHANDLPCNENTSDNAQATASVLSHSVSSLSQQVPSSTSSRPFNRAVSGPVVTPGGYRASLLVAGERERPLVRARRVPIEEKRRQDAEMERRDREETEREREGKKLRLREKEKENWATRMDPPPMGAFLRVSPPETRVFSISTRFPFVY